VGKYNQQLTSHKSMCYRKI